MSIYVYTISKRVHKVGDIVIAPMNFFGKEPTVFASNEQLSRYGRAGTRADNARDELMDRGVVYFTTAHPGPGCKVGEPVFKMSDTSSGILPSLMTDSRLDQCIERGSVVKVGEYAKDERGRYFIVKEGEAAELKS